MLTGHTVCPVIQVFQCHFRFEHWTEADGGAVAECLEDELCISEYADGFDGAVLLDLGLGMPKGCSNGENFCVLGVAFEAAQSK
jgi:hypothetical protein